MDSLDPPANDYSPGHISWTSDPGSPVFPQPSVDCSRGRFFTFEMNLPKGVKRVLPVVTVDRHRGFHPSAPLKLDTVPVVSSLNGEMADIEYALTSPASFRVLRRCWCDDVSYVLRSIIERD